MSTRCYIGTVMPDQTVKAIYCHSDGYPDGVGRILNEYYQDENKVRQLIDLGSLSFLGAEIGESNPFGSKDINFDICCAYHRDRGSKLEHVEFYSVNNFIKQRDIFIEWRYLWKDNKWHTFKGLDKLKTNLRVWFN